MTATTHTRYVILRTLAHGPLYRGALPLVTARSERQVRDALITLQREGLVTISPEGTVALKLAPTACVLCGEAGADAEMAEPDADEGYPVHAECGLAAGWRIA